MGSLMTVSVASNLVQTYAGNGSTTAFAYTHRFDETDELVVILRSSAGVDTVKTLTTHYAVSGEGNDAGGTVTMLTAPASGETLIIYRKTEEKQTVDLENASRNDAPSVELQLDRMTRVAQDHGARLDRAVTMRPGSNGQELPEPSASKYLRWSSAGTALENVALVAADSIEVLDEDDMASNDASAVPSQQSVKAYVDGQALLDSELTDEAAVKALDQGVATTDSPEFAGLSVPSINGGPLGDFRNAMVNGNFDVWQSGTSGFTSNGYTADQWYVTTTNKTSEVSRGAFTAGQTDVPGSPDYYQIWDVTATTGTGETRVYNVVEGADTFANGQATVTFWAKLSSGTADFVVKLVQDFGSGGSADVSTAGQTVGLTASWQKISLVFDLASTAGKTFGSGHKLDVEIAPDDTNSTFQLHLARSSLVKGDARNEDDTSGYVDPVMELRRAWRYLRALGGAAIYEIFATGVCGTTTAAYVLVPFDTGIMRTTPSFSYSALGDFALQTGTSFVSPTGLTAVIGSAGAYLTHTQASGLTTGGAAILQAKNTLSARLIFNSRI